MKVTAEIFEQIKLNCFIGFMPNHILLDSDDYSSTLLKYDFICNDFRFYLVEITYEENLKLVNN